MKPARTSKRHLEETKLLIFSQEEPVVHSRVSEITEYLNSGDLLVVNRSGTLPSSFRGKIERSGEELEIRLASFQGPSRSQLENWFAFAFGEGDWRSPTEERGAPPELIPGDRIIIGPELFAQVLHIEGARLLSIRWVSRSLEQALYKYGKPIQYSYLKEELNTWDQQTIFSGPPISVEPPSSAFPLSWKSIFKLKDHGVEVASLLHGAGISSTGCKSLDKKLPLEEWYEIPRETVKKIHRAQREGRRIIALGTTVLRALESAWKKGEVVLG